MKKNLDFVRETSYAKRLSDASLDFAIRDAWATFRIWERELPENDPDGNRAYYEDQHAVYVAERDRRRRATTRRSKVI